MNSLAYALAALVVLGVPSSAYAAVLINEIAWMGSAASANDEWIELYNNGTSAVVLDGWTISDSADLLIELSGSIGAGAYAVLERTDDTSAPGSAFLIYTGALPNTGTTLTLYRADGSVEDQVAGGEGWGNIGGDNATKETSQYSESGWITNTPTPGSANKSTSSETVAVSEDRTETEADTGFVDPRDGSEDESGSSGKNERISLELPDTELVLSITAPDRAYVNQPLVLGVEPSGISEGLLDSVTYAWNFGDTHTGEGKEVEHAYAYPGEYVITVHGAYARHEKVARQRITVLPTTLSIFRTENGDVQVHNDARYEIDVSGYTVVGHRLVTFPEHTIMLPQATLTIPKRMIGTATVFLYDQKQMLVARSDDATSSSDQSIVARLTPAMQPVRSLPVEEESLSTEYEPFAFTSDVLSASVAQAFDETEIQLPVQETEVAATDQAVPSTALPYLGLIGILGLGILAMYMGRDNTAGA